MWLSFFIKGPPPDGYVEKFGDMVGTGIGSHFTSFIEDCVMLCSNRNDCCAIEYSHSLKECQLHKECTPNNTPYKDFITYQKGIWVTILFHNFDSIVP